MFHRIASTVTTIVLASANDATQALHIENLSEPVRMVFPYVSSNGTLPENITIAVKFFNVSSNEWSDAGCNSTYNATTQQLVAVCNHLTDFAGFFARFVPNIIIINPFDVGPLTLSVRPTIF